MPKFITSKAEIIETCLSLFAQYGYSYVSIKKIADEVGISKATLYHYFRTKKEVLGLCADRYISEINQCISIDSNPKIWLTHFYKDKLETGCFMFNMMACKESRQIINTQINEFTSILGSAGLKNDDLTHLLGSLFFSKISNSKQPFNIFIKSLKEGAYEN